MYRKSLLDESMPYLAGGDITCGLPLTTIDRITMECGVIVPYEVYKARYAIYNDVIREAVFHIVEDTLSGCPHVEARHYEDTADEDEIGNDAPSNESDREDSDDIDSESDNEDLWDEDVDRLAIYSDNDL